ncbi:hypothetical protein [Arthrobacter sp. CAN_C5]|uniref:hypothetical protein n=1 Tax=Arthrobacter sp. CAN_C5 TaxID=2760706 RepID=UPI001FDA4BF8|nr:hypothetical protein [Arthrobacter sp. CAN_C5]
MLTERLGALGHPFDEGDRNRTLGTYGQVMRIVRNRLSHGDTFEAFDALHAVDTVRTILAHIGDESGTVVAAGIRTALISEFLENSDTGIGGRTGPNEKTDTSFSGQDSVGNLGEKGSSMSDAASGNRSSWLWE